MSERKSDTAFFVLFEDAEDSCYGDIIVNRNLYFKGFSVLGEQ